MIYIIVFLLSILFAYLANKSKSKTACIFLLFISALFPILLAGFRDISIGTDTSNYYGKLVQALRYDTFDQFRKISDMEVGFVLFTYLCSKITDSQIAYFIFVHSLVIIPVFVALYRCRSFVNFANALFIYYFIFYCATLNTTRQAIAVSIVLLSLSYLVYNEKCKSLILIFFAYLFHRTAILFFFIYLIYIFTRKYNIRQNVGKYFIAITFILIFLYVLVNYINILDVIIGQRENYATYLLSVDDSNISKSSLILYLFVFILIWRAYILYPNNILSFFLIVSLFSIGMIFLTIIAPVFSRLNMYFNIIQVFSIPYILNNSFVAFNGKKKKLASGFSKVTLFLYILILWYFSVIIKQSNQVYPYLFI